MKKRLRIIIPVLLIVAGVLVYNMVIKNGEVGDTVIVSGNIEVTQARLGFKIPGTLSKRPVEEGDTVKMGQILAVLDDRDQKAAVARAEADVAYSQSVVAELEAGSRPQEIGIIDQHRTR